jgi:FeoB-associated Cys-rich membrane protein
MSWQLPVVVVVVFVAATYLVRQTWLTWTKRKGCGSGCSCTSQKKSNSQSGSVTLIPESELRVRTQSST